MRQSVKLWLEALESGEWKQTRGALERQGRNCCLGVACRIYEKKFPGKLIIEKKKGEAVVFFDGSTGILPPKVKEWLGLRTGDGRIRTHNLIEENDTEKKSFKQIAQIIRDNAKDLFVDGEL